MDSSPSLSYGDQATAAVGENRLVLNDPRSLNGIMRRYCRERLYVHPLKWTSRHMEVLDCHWRPIEVPELVDEGLAYIGGISAELDNPKAKVIRAAIRRLGSGSPSSLSIVHIRRMLKEFGSTSVEYFLNVYFNGERVEKLRTDGIFRLPGWGLPYLAFVDLAYLAARREFAFLSRSLYRHPQNLPILRIYEKKHRQCKPNVEVEDPWIVAALISLAQKQRLYRDMADTASSEQTETPASDSDPFTDASDEPMLSYKVHVIALPADRQSLCFYSANIPEVFLHKFDLTSIYFPSPPIEVSYHSVPLRQELRSIDAIDALLSSASSDNGVVTE